MTDGINVTIDRDRQMVVNLSAKDLALAIETLHGVELATGNGPRHALEVAIFVNLTNVGEVCQLETEGMAATWEVRVGDLQAQALDESDPTRRAVGDTLWRAAHLAKCLSQLHASLRDHERRIASATPPQVVPAP